LKGKTTKPLDKRAVRKRANHLSFIEALNEGDFHLASKIMDCLDEMENPQERFACYLKIIDYAYPRLMPIDISDNPQKADELAPLNNISDNTLQALLEKL
jgi:hypothetical protein